MASATFPGRRRSGGVPPEQRYPECGRRSIWDALQGTEGHYGLLVVRERARLIGGNLTVWSEVDAGIEVELRVPATTYKTARRGCWLS